MAYSRKLETKTLARMIAIYCHDVHGLPKDQLCPDCQSLQKYAEQRIEKCIYKDDKPVCSRCPVHCYKPGMKEKIKEVMVYSGPRMIWKSPILSLRHFYRVLYKSNVSKQ